MSTQVKGAVLVARRAFVLEDFGKEAWSRVLEALAPEDRKVLQGLILPSTWYPFDLNDRLDRAIVSALGGGSQRVFEAMGTRSAEENLAGPHKHFLAPGDPAKFMTKAGRIYSFYYDTGRREWEPSGPNAGILTTHNAETFSNTDCLTVIGWYKKALEMCGAKQVKMTEETCRAKGGQVCRYRVSWAL
jgi:uncharacterized protein (TIGR02265 family)